MNLAGRGCEDVGVKRIGVVAVLLALAAAGCGGGSSAGARDGSTPHVQVVDYTKLHGAVPSQHTAKPTFRLTDTSGRPYHFRARTEGYATLLYFGYTHCPDECPTAMADLAAALRRTDPAVARQVKVVFVTTDPWRDNRQVLRRWLDKFSPGFVGLTGTPTQVAGAEVQLGMPISKREAAPKSYGSGRYAVEHMAAVIAYGRNDLVATLYPSGVTPGEIAADLPLLVKG
jgi:protein SCO1/2